MKLEHYEHDAFVVRRKSLKFTSMEEKDLDIKKLRADIKIDSSLEKYKGKVFFPEKLAKANEMLRISGPPKIKKKN